MHYKICYSFKTSFSAELPLRFLNRLATHFLQKTSEACYILHIYKYFLNHHIIGQVVPLQMKALACVLLPASVKPNEYSLEIPVL